MAETDRVRPRSSPVGSDHVERETLRRLRRYADRENGAIVRRLRRLDREWDIERVLALNAAVVGLAGLALGVTRDRRWLALPGAVFSFLALHALQGSCPPVTILRQLGVRTRREIERERYALKAMRGDFDGTSRRSQAAWRAVRD